ncbi:DNA-binding protein MNB1B-like [Asparagus officinalis]|uniref:DNA-binding protein MNB1B-like n=1 Tax=Asparagus officinalis TaxID=4686 RepID=UPI00098E028C|nr:DNA-binding protein MNB1B-like [Asparagus officinalis]
MKGRKPKASSSKASESKLAVKKTEKKVKKGKDPNKPKRAPSAFFVFMEGFRKEFKEKNPRNKSVAAVGKAGGERWKSMSDSDKAPFVSKAEKLKAEYEKKIAAYNRGEKVDDNVVEEEESDKSKSEVEQEEGSGSEEEGDEDDD